MSPLVLLQVRAAYIAVLAWRVSDYLWTLVEKLDAWT